MGIIVFIMAVTTPHVEKFFASQQRVLTEKTQYFYEELKQLRSQQSQVERTFEQEEKKARHVFFAAHADGPMQRSYVQSFLRRREQLQKTLHETLVERTAQQHKALEVLKAQLAEDKRAYMEDLNHASAPDVKRFPYFRE